MENSLDISHERRTPASENNRFYPSESIRGHAQKHEGPAHSGSGHSRQKPPFVETSELSQEQARKLASGYAEQETLNGITAGHLMQMREALLEIADDDQHPQKKVASKLLDDLTPLIGSGSRFDPSKSLDEQFQDPEERKAILRFLHRFMGIQNQTSDEKRARDLNEARFKWREETQLKWQAIQGSPEMQHRMLRQLSPEEKKKAQVLLSKSAKDLKDQDLEYLNSWLMQPKPAPFTYPYREIVGEEPFRYLNDYEKLQKIDLTRMNADEQRLLEAYENAARRKAALKR